MIGALLILYSMRDFEFYFPTRIFFGKKSLKTLETELSKFGKKILFVYGRNAIKNLGLYERITNIFVANGISWEEFSGVKPNPPLRQVFEGIEIARDFKPDLILAVGGGSVIDCAKAIACGYFIGERLWDLFERKGQVERAIPIVTIPTVAGTGSEVNDVTVIVNEDKGLKLSLRSPLLFPKASFIDPTVTFSLSREQTAYGLFDAFSHLFEYFHFRLHREEGLNEEFLVLLMRTLIERGRTLMQDQKNYVARSEIFWISSLALSPFVRAGLGAYRFFLHSLEHPLSGSFDQPHGLGLAILMRAYLKRFSHTQIVRRFFLKVLQIEAGQDLSKRGLRAFDNLLEEFGLPKTLREIGVRREDLKLLVEKAWEILYFWKAETEFNSQIVQEIYELAYEE